MTGLLDGLLEKVLHGEDSIKVRALRPLAQSAAEPVELANPRWLGRTRGRQYPPSRHMNEEEDVQPLEVDRVQAKDVSRDHTFRVRPETAPSSALSPPVASQGQNRPARVVGAEF